jgi:hypothetical protein
MLLLNCGQSDPAVVARVLLAADPKQAEVQRSTRAGQHPGLVELFPVVQIGPDPSARLG